MPDTDPPQNIIRITGHEAAQKLGAHHRDAIAALQGRLLDKLPEDGEFKVSRGVLEGLVRASFLDGASSQITNPFE